MVFHHKLGGAGLCGLSAANPPFVTRRELGEDYSESITEQSVSLDCHRVGIDAAD